MSKVDFHEEPSDMFVDAIKHGAGSAYIECGYCERQHLCVNSDYGDTERENWASYCEEAYDACPENTILHYDVDFVRTKELNGISFVIGCPCNGLAKYEKFIWAERDSIRNYLQARINHEFELAQQEKVFNKVAGFDSKEKNPYFYD